MVHRVAVRHHENDFASKPLICEQPLLDDALQVPGPMTFRVVGIHLLPKVGVRTGLFILRPVVGPNFFVDVGDPTVRALVLQEKSAPREREAHRVLLGGVPLRDGGA